MCRRTYGSCTSKNTSALSATARQAGWALLHTRGMADVIAADLSRMAPLHQLMRQMRAQAEQAAQEAVREREAKARADAQADAAKPAKLVVRSADEFEF